ncbi:30S ribosomal protein S13 [Candidatus Pacearchaeota archaeon]|nr:30S ribosomal protein S13 [Candidatus Pacearchaeota archaeon]
MAEQKQKTKDNPHYPNPKDKKEAVKKIPQKFELEDRGRIIRIMQKDIEGRMKLYPGLTKIKGISWSLSNAVCKKLGFDKNRKIESLSESEIKKLEEFNRQKDFETGEDGHLIGSNLELRKEFDIKRMKKIKSYKGYRHVAGLPVRGQRTRAHFRKNRSRGAGIKKK